MQGYSISSTIVTSTVETSIPIWGISSSTSVVAVEVIFGVTFPANRLSYSPYSLVIGTTEVEVPSYNPTNYESGVSISDFSLEKGLDLIESSKGMSYLYGLSDFWVNIFADSEKLDILLGASTLQYSEVYSNFLQKASQISLESIQEVTGSQTRLLILNSTAAVPGALETYYLPESILASRYLANRPLLPTKSYEEGVHYSINTEQNSISFALPLDSMGFPIRKNMDGTTSYSIWGIDTRVDEELIYNSFGKLIGAPNSVETLSYKDFIASMYYLYTNGPTIGTIVKGLNISLGIPLARETETVMAIERYLTTDNYIVITNNNSYLIPYGLQPVVTVGQHLNTFEQLANWVEVKEYSSDGEWWLNLYIPSSVIPFTPTYNDRYAVAGGYADYLMRNFLKTNTFLVNIKTTIFRNMQSFSQVAEVINRVKPSHATLVYLWTIPTETEDIAITDTFNAGSMNLTSSNFDYSMSEYHTLGEDTGYLMGEARITLGCGPERLLRLFGYSPIYNGPLRAY